MSISKYMKAYKDMGFFAGSIIRVTITDSSYHGQELILMSGSDILATRTIAGETTDIFTNASGTLTVSAENSEGTVISADVEVSTYATYNVTLSGASPDRERQIYVNKESVTIDDDIQSDSVVVAYTGDKTVMSASASNSMVDVSVKNGVVTVSDNGSDFQGRSTITATVNSSSKFDSAEISFYVNKLNGTYGTWGESTDDVITNMIALADAGEIKLSDYWNVGETRTVSLSAMTAGTATSAQPEQEIELVILHNPVNDDTYRLTTPTSGLRYQPNFVIGVKNCLERTSAMGFIGKSIVADSRKTTTGYVYCDESNVSELLSDLNNKFVLALPEYIQNILKFVNRRYCCGLAQDIRPYANGNLTYTSMDVKSHKVSMANLKELGFTQAVSNYSVTYGAYINSGSFDSYDKSTPNLWVNALNSCGTAFDYYTNTDNLIKSKGIDGYNIEYFICDSLLSAYYEDSNHNHSLAVSMYMDETGTIQTNNLTSESQRVAQRGISPIMFI